MKKYLQKAKVDLFSDRVKITMTSWNLDYDALNS